MANLESAKNMVGKTVSHLSEVALKILPNSTLFTIFAREIRNEKGENLIKLANKGFTEGRTPEEDSQLAEMFDETLEKLTNDQSITEEDRQIRARYLKGVRNSVLG